MFSSSRTLQLLLICGVLGAALMADAPAKAVKSGDTNLFDFKDEARLKDWVPVKLPELKTEQSAPRIEIVPTPKTAAQDSPAGKSLKITFDGGDWPTIGTSKIPVQGNWKEFQTFKAHLIVDRPCFAYFRICQAKPAKEKDSRSACFERTMALVPGGNEVTLALVTQFGPFLKPENGDVTSFVIGMYQPDKGQTLLVANVRLSPDGPLPKEFLAPPSPHNLGGYSVASARQYQRAGALPKFKVLGTDMEVTDVRELGRQLKDQWTKPDPKTVDQVEAEFKAEFDKFKKAHPNAVMAVLREGDRGSDPARPEQIYSGWKVLHLDSHGPEGPNRGREVSPQGPEVEAFMRHRVALMRADLTCIPKDATILAARLAVTRAGSKRPEKPNMWVAEACNRDWDENVANCYLYARGKFWKAVVGIYYGEDPDCWPVFLAHGPGGSGDVSVWNFTEAVRFWRDGSHANCGFFLHGDGNDGMMMYTAKAKDIKQRPVLLVIYEPKS